MIIIVTFEANRKRVQNLQDIYYKLSEKLLYDMNLKRVINGKNGLTK